MPIPNALKERRAKLMAAEAEALTAPAVQAPAAPLIQAPAAPLIQTPAAPLIQAPVAPAAPELDLEKAKQDYASMLGRASAESKRAEQAESQLLEYKAQVAQAQQERDELLATRAQAERTARLAALDDDSGVTDEEMSQVNPDDLRIFKSVGAKKFSPVIRQMAEELDTVRKELAELRGLGAQIGQIGQTHSRIAAQDKHRQERDALDKRLSPHVSDWVAVTQHPEWQSFMAEPLTPADPNMTRKAFIEGARKVGDIGSIVAVFNQFKGRTSPSGSVGMAALATPAASSVNRSASESARFKTSEYKVLHARYVRGGVKTKEQKDQWEQHKVAFEAALADGRVDDDAKML